MNREREILPLLRRTAPPGFHRFVCVCVRVSAILSAFLTNIIECFPSHILSLSPCLTCLAVEKWVMTLVYVPAYCTCCKMVYCHFHVTHQQKPTSLAAIFIGKCDAARARHPLSFCLQGSKCPVCMCHITDTRLGWTKATGKLRWLGNNPKPPTICMDRLNCK